MAKCLPPPCIGILAVLVIVLGLSGGVTAQSGSTNPFLDLLNRLRTITTYPGQTVSDNRELAKEKFPISYSLTSKGFTPGRNELFAFVVNQKWYQARTDTLEKWLISRGAYMVPEDTGPVYMEWQTGDRFISYNAITITPAATKLTIAPLQGITKTMLLEHKITMVVVAIAPEGDIKKNDFSRAHAVIINYR